MEKNAFAYNTHCRHCWTGLGKTQLSSRLCCQLCSMALSIVVPIVVPFLLSLVNYFLRSILCYPCSKLLVMMSMNTTIYMFVARDPFMEFCVTTRGMRNHTILMISLIISKFSLNKCVITLLTDRKSAAHIYTHYAQMHTRRLKIMNMNVQTNQYINKQAKVINICNQEM